MCRVPWPIPWSKAPERSRIYFGNVHTPHSFFHVSPSLQCIRDSTVEGRLSNWVHLIFVSRVNQNIFSDCKEPFINDVALFWKLFVPLSPSTRKGQKYSEIVRTVTFPCQISPSSVTSYYTWETFSNTQHDSLMQIETFPFISKISRCYTCTHIRCSSKLL